jgi:hypothetical protein
MRRLPAAAVAILLAIPSLSGAQVPVVGEPLCARLNMVDAGRGVLIVTADDRLVTVRAADVGDQLAVLAPGEDVVVMTSPGFGADDYRATAIHREWVRGRVDAWRCLRGFVLSASPETVVVRTGDGEIVAADRRAAVQDVRDVLRGERVVVVGRVVGADPTALAATRIRLLPR